MKTTLTDAQIDAQARAYQITHRVDYSEALTAVTSSFADTASASYSQAPARATITDAQIDAQAQKYARTHQTSYAEALTAVTSSFADTSSSYSEPSAIGSAGAVLEGQWIEVFKAGTQIDNQGRAISFSGTEVLAIASNYNPARHEAPLILGHQEDNRPAYGWVKELQATPDGRLLMRAGQIDPAFAEMVRAGRFKKRSASFYPPQSPINPAPGSWYLRHVAWLGAMPPAVQGMPDPAFGVGDGCVSFTF